MDVILLVISIILLLVGLAGAVLPLPGPPLSFAGILVLNYSSFGNFTEDFLIGLGTATVLVTILDYYVPIWGTKKFGGTKFGIRGSIAGMIIGLFFGPFGLFIGAFLGAMIGELLLGDKQNALRAAIGSFAGFAAGIVMKVTLCGFMIFYAILEIFS